MDGAQIFMQIMIMCSIIYLWCRLYQHVSVCVCKRERERERERKGGERESTCVEGI